MKHDIFLSYSDKDRGVAEAVCRHLEAGGARCWMAPRDISAGEEWGRAILEAIEKTSLFIVLFSSNSNASKQVLREVERAVKNDRILLPVRLEDIPPSKSLEYFLSVTQWFDALTPFQEARWVQLTKEVLRILGRSSDQPSQKLPSKPQRGADLRYELTLTLAEAVLGIETTLRIPRLEQCDKCKGTGVENGLVCTTCGGDTRLERERSITVKIPAGVDMGARLRLAGEGEAGPYGGPSGDLYVVVVDVQEDSKFRREGSDVFSDFVISSSLARSGGVVEIPTLLGNVKAQIPAGLVSGKSLRLKGKGAPLLGSSTVGDHFVKILVKG